MLISSAALAGPALVAVAVLVALLIFSRSSGVWRVARAATIVQWIVGFSLIGIVLIWNIVAGLESYVTWFVPEAYPAIRWTNFGLALAGIVLLMVAHLAAIREQQVRSQANDRLAALTELLAQVQSDSGKLGGAELLQRSLTGLTGALGAEKGAVLLRQRSDAAPIVAAAVGLAPVEVGLFESAPKVCPAWSEALSEYPAHSQQQIRRLLPEFPGSAAMLAVPLGPESEQLGSLAVLFAEEPGDPEALTTGLQAVAGLLYSRLQYQRSAREFRALQDRFESIEQRLARLTTGLKQLHQDYHGASPLDGLCRAIALHLEADEAGVLVVVQEQLQLRSGTLSPLSDALRTAFGEALSRNKPVLVNQESTAAGDVQLVSSSLVIPFATRHGEGLVIRRLHGPIASHDSAIALAEQTAMLLEQLDRDEQLRLDGRLHRRALEQLLGLLRPGLPTDDKALMQFVATQAHALFPGASHVGVALRSEDEEVWYSSHRTEGLSSDRFHDGLKASSPVTFATDFRSLSGAEFRHWMEGSLPIGPFRDELLGGQESRPFCLLMPWSPEPRTHGLILVTGEVRDGDQRYWETYLRLWHGLLQLRLATEQSVRQVRAGGESFSGRTDLPDQNKVNNLLASILGSAELMKSKLPEGQPDHRRAVDIISAVESLAMTLTARPSKSPVAEQIAHSLPGLLREQLASARIAGDLYMLAGRPREIVVRASSDAESEPFSDAGRSLLESVINRFAVLAQDDDAITCSCSVRESYLYLDLCRHRRNFPPIDNLAAIADYRPVERIQRERSSEPYLPAVGLLSGEVAIDPVGLHPAYLSFRFPLKMSPGVAEPVSSGTQVRVLAIDDQPVILDLIAAMCQSLGCEVDRAASGEDGVRLAQQHRYDLVLTDLSMPDLSGLDVARKVREFRPGTPVALVTGFDKGLSEEELRRAGIRVVLRKPFRIEQLTDLIRDLVPVKS